MVRKKRRGAPPKSNPATERIELRCTAEQHRSWMAAAVAVGKSLSAWIKDLADKNAR